MKQIDKIVKGIVEPNDINVLWLDTNDPKSPTLKAYADGEWKAISSGEGGGGSAEGAVSYNEQTLTEAQQMQARKNQGLYRKDIESGVGYVFPGPYVYDVFAADSLPFVGTRSTPAIPDNPNSSSNPYIEWEVSGYFNIDTGNSVSNLSITGGEAFYNNDTGYPYEVTDVTHRNNYDIINGAGTDIYLVKANGVNVRTSQNPLILDKGLWVYASGFGIWTLQNDGEYYWYDQPYSFFEWALSELDLVGDYTHYIKVPSVYLPITTSLSASSTDNEVPGAKTVYDIIGNVETLLAAL